MTDLDRTGVGAGDASATRPAPGVGLLRAELVAARESESCDQDES